jgi:hypothetical protein
MASRQKSVSATRGLAGVASFRRGSWVAYLVRSLGDELPWRLASIAPDAAVLQRGGEGRAGLGAETVRVFEPRLGVCRPSTSIRPIKRRLYQHGARRCATYESRHDPYRHTIRINLQLGAGCHTGCRSFGRHLSIRAVAGLWPLPYLSFGSDENWPSGRPAPLIFLGMTLGWLRSRQTDICPRAAAVGYVQGRRSTDMHCVRE